MKVIGENRIADLWDRIKNYVDPKADKIPEVNHGTSDTTFTLTPNIMHIWGEVSSLTLFLSTDTNSVLDEYMFTFTCPSAAATNLTLPSSIKWIQQPELLAGKTYQVSIVNGLAGYLTDDMPATGQDNIIETVKVNGTALTPDANKAVDITVPLGTVTSVTVNGSNYTPDTNGLVNLGTISGGSGSGGEYNVIEGVTFNGTTAPITNKIAAITYTAPTLSKGTTTGSGNAVTDISVSGHTVTLTKGSTFLTSYTETDPTVPAAVKAITATDISNWNSKASTDTKNTAGATATTVTGSNKFYLIGAPEQTANPTTNTINYFYVDASGLNIPTNIYALNQTATLGKIILPGTGGGILADGTGGVQSTTKVWNTFGSYTDISGFATDSNVVHKTGAESINGKKTFDADIEIGQSYIRGTYNQGDFGFIVSDNDGTDVSLQDILDGIDQDITSLNSTGYSTTNKQFTFGGHTTTTVTAATVVTDGGGEKTSNKVTSISSSSTNTQYPSALAVYNYGQTITSSLATIYSGSGAPTSSLGNNGDIYIKVT